MRKSFGITEFYSILFCMDSAVYRRTVWIVLLILLVVITLPYFLAWRAAGADAVFGGFLFNPLDGNSYLAKMYEGWAGAWVFTLPYTPEIGRGNVLFLFYLFLGHAARWLGLPLILVFHLARVASAALLVWALAYFFAEIFPSDPKAARLGLILASFGSGMGWAVFALGVFTSDFWVAEAYPFLSAYATPHFPLGLALLLGLLVGAAKPLTIVRRLTLVLGGLMLAVVLPFGVVVLAVVLVGRALWDRVHGQPLALEMVFWPMLLGGPFLLYQYWVTLQDPLLALWNAQNLTPSPGIGDFVLSFSPALFLAGWGVWKLWKQPLSPAQGILIPWLVLGILLVYLPFPLQRRFLLGFYIPTAALAVVALRDVLRRRPWLFGVVLILSLPTSLVVPAAGVAGVASHSPKVTLTRAEWAGLAWVRENTPRDALILASPESGLLIPAYTGRRVIYGHPFETVNAKERKAGVEDFFAGRLSASGLTALLTREPVGYLWLGARERALQSAGSAWALPQGSTLVYDEASLQIYALRQGE